MRKQPYRLTTDPDKNADFQIPNYLYPYSSFWYPRWWLISAIFCILAIGIFSLGSSISSCPNTESFFCWFDAWHPLLQVSLIWFLFFIVRVIAMMFGLKPIELSRGKRSTLARFFKAVSEFENISFLLLIYGAFALIALMIMWLFGPTLPLAFAATSIVVFVANSNIFYRRLPNEQRSYLIGYGVLGLLACILTILYRFEAAETPFLLAEGLLIFFGVCAIFWRPHHFQQPIEQELVDANLVQVVSPIYLLRQYFPFNRLLPNRSVGNDWNDRDQTKSRGG